MPRSAKKNHTKTPAAVTPHPTGTQPLSAPTGGDYGEHKALIDSQRAAPLPGPAPSAPPVADPRAAADAMAPQHAGLMAPSARPDEPVTAGLPSGPGPGPEALGGLATPTGPDPAAMLRAVYQVAPNADLADLIHYFQGY